MPSKLFHYQHLFSHIASSVTAFGAHIHNTTQSQVVEIQQFMFTNMLILSVCNCTMYTFIWLLNTTPLGISYKNVSDCQFYTFTLTVSHFQGISLWRKHFLEIISWLLFPFPHLLQKAARQSYYTCWCVVWSPKVFRRLPLQAASLQHSDVSLVQVAPELLLTVMKTVVH